MRWLMPLALAALAGCGRGFYSGTGEVTGVGGTLGNWSAAPIGCVRHSAFEDQAEPSIVTFVWRDPRDYIRGPALNVMWQNNAPLRLDIEADGDGKGSTVALLRTLTETRPSPAGGKTPLRRIERSACTLFQLHQQQRPALEPAGRPVLDGELTMSCAVGGGHLAAHLRFTGCEY